MLPLTLFIALGCYDTSGGEGPTIFRIPGRAPVDGQVAFRFTAQELYDTFKDTPTHLYVPFRGRMVNATIYGADYYGSIATVTGPVVQLIARKVTLGVDVQDNGIGRTGLFGIELHDLPSDDFHSLHFNQIISTTCRIEDFKLDKIIMKNCRLEENNYTPEPTATPESTALRVNNSTISKGPCDKFHRDLRTFDDISEDALGTIVYSQCESFDKDRILALRQLGASLVVREGCISGPTDPENPREFYTSFTCKDERDLWQRLEDAPYLKVNSCSTWLRTEGELWYGMVFEMPIKNEERPWRWLTLYILNRNICEPTDPGDR